MTSDTKAATTEDQNQAAAQASGDDVANASAATGAAGDETTETAAKATAADELRASLADLKKGFKELGLSIEDEVKSLVS